MNDAPALLLIVAMRGVLWPVAPVALHAEAWNIVGAIAIIALLTMLGVRSRWDDLTRAVAGWMAFEETLVVHCSAAYIVDPWPIVEGGQRCSDMFGFKTEAAELYVLAMFTWLVANSVNGARAK